MEGCADGPPEARPAGVALVTGASSGIGDALARELRSRGYGLIVAARREDRLQKLADELGETHVIACDLADPDVALTSAFLPSMVRRGSGAILNVASTAGLGSLPNSAGYSAAKHHSRAFSESLHHELRGQGIAVTALSRPRLHRPLGERRGSSDRGSHPQAALD